MRFFKPIVASLRVPELVIFTFRSYLRNNIGLTTMMMATFCPSILKHEFHHPASLRQRRRLFAPGLFCVLEKFQDAIL